MTKEESSLKKQCKLLLKLVEYHDEQLTKYKLEFDVTVKLLPADEFYLFCIETGYPNCVIS